MREFVIGELVLIKKDSDIFYNHFGQVFKQTTGSLFIRLASGLTREYSKLDVEWYKQGEGRCRASTETSER